VLTILGIVVLAACSSSTTSASADNSTSMAYQKALAYAQCIRAHGIPDYPDPNSQGQFIISNGGSAPPSVSAAVANAAAQACQKLLPPSMAQGPPSNAPAGSNTQALKFSVCMRSHGEPNFPDPAANGSFSLPPGMNAESPQFQNAAKACQSLRPNPPGGGTAS
jgi:hypothetical protein